MMGPTPSAFPLCTNQGRPWDRGPANPILAEMGVGGIEAAFRQATHLLQLHLAALQDVAMILVALGVGDALGGHLQCMPRILCPGSLGLNRRTRQTRGFVGNADQSVGVQPTSSSRQLTIFVRDGICAYTRGGRCFLCTGSPPCLNWIHRCVQASH